MMLPVEVSVVIVNYETSSMVRRCVESLLRQGVAHEIIVVDNPSDLNDVEHLRDLPVRLVENAENVGYGMGVNAGAATATGRAICVLDPDTVLPPATLERWIASMDRAEAPPPVGCLAPQLVNDNGVPQRSVYGFVNPANYWLHHSLLAGWLKWLAKRSACGRRRAAGPVREVDWVMGAAMLFPRAAWTAVGGFSQRYFLYAEDMDICWRLHKAGFSVRYAPEVLVTHTQGEPAAQTRDLAALRLFTGLKEFADQHYPPIRRAGVIACVIADMALRITLFAVPAALDLREGLYRSRVRGYMKVLRLYIMKAVVRGD